MRNSLRRSYVRSLTAFAIGFGLCVAIGAVLAFAQPAVAAPIGLSAAHPDLSAIQAVAQVTSTNDYLGPEWCSECHKDIHGEWTGTRHAAAFSSPIFQEAWTKDPNKNACLQCHTTGYNPADGS